MTTIATTLSSGWLSSSKNTPCPVCGRTKDGDCVFTQDKSRVHCHTAYNPDSKVPQPGDRVGEYWRTGEVVNNGWCEGVLYKKDWKKPVRTGQETYDYYSAQDELILRVVIQRKEGGKKVPYQQLYLPDTRVHHPILARHSYSKNKGFLHVSQNKVTEGKATQEELDYYKRLEEVAFKKVSLYGARSPIVRSACEKGNKVIFVEGEGKVDALQKLGVAAVTSIAGSKNFANLKFGISNYLQDLKGAGGIVICPDRDVPGIQYGLTVASFYQDAGFPVSWLYVEPEHPAWKSLPHSDGFDVKDWIPMLSSEGMAPEDVITKLRSCVSDENPLEKGVYTAPEPELELEDEDKNIRKEQVSVISQAFNRRLNMERVFGEAIAETLKDTAQALPVLPEAVMQPFLAIAASMIGCKALVEITPGYREPCVLWTNFVGEPGSKKSPVLRAVMEPLVDLQAEARRQYEVAMNEYKRDKANWERAKKEGEDLDPEDEPKEPHMRHYFLEDYSIEFLASAHAESESSNGFALPFDELAEFIGQMQRYNTNNVARKKTLSLHTGKHLKIDRKSGPGVFVKRTAVSVTGGLQLDVWRDELTPKPSDKKDSDGMWARFLSAFSPFISARERGNPANNFGVFQAVYRALDSLEGDVDNPKIYKLSNSAQQLHLAFELWIEERKKHATPALTQALSKMVGHVARLALVIHCLDMTINGTATGTVISKDTMQRAIELADFYLDQTRLLYTYVFDSKEGFDLQYKIIQKSQERGGEWVHDRELVTSHYCSTITEARQALITLGESSGQVTNGHICRGSVSWALSPSGSPTDKPATRERAFSEFYEQEFAKL